ncbi:MAG TPA: NAD(+) diphosphatase [Ktedonobacteraceae bacterium]|nr:NAD(+) diphosphatase [Ktedonobacteraceae bacterium]
MASSFQRAYPPATAAGGPVFWLPFQTGKLLVQGGEQGIKLIHIEEAEMAQLQPQNVLHVGSLAGIACLAFEVDAEQSVSQGWQALSLRALFGQIDDAAYSAAGYASQLLHWQRHSRYCPACGAPNGDLAESWGRQCTQCGHMGFPLVSPAVLVLVHNGEHVLLAHQPGWGPRYSILAGFVEPGESLEECVRREVAEEVGVEITDITYAGSQPWPFPHQLMVGFTARYAGGEIRPDQQEIDHAAWFRFDQVPPVPSLISLSGQLIMAWIEKQRSAHGKSQEEKSRLAGMGK